jgi:hypothetical protein
MEYEYNVVAIYMFICITYNRKVQFKFIYYGKDE